MLVPRNDYYGGVYTVAPVMDSIYAHYAVLKVLSISC